MLTRFIRVQLVVFAIASVVGVLAMGFFYLQVPTLLGIGRTTITMELPVSGGLYRFSNVTLRGVQVGKVTAVDLEPTKVVATISLSADARIPVDSQAKVRSMSAVGEQYIDLVPGSSNGPYLADGSVIPMSNVSVPEQIGPVLDQASALLATIPEDRLGDLVDETYRGLAGAGYDLGSLLDSGAEISSGLNPVADSARRLTVDAVPLLEGQEQTADAVRSWARNLAGVTDQIQQNDPDIRTLLDRGPGFAGQVSGLLNQVKPTLPVFLANLTSVGQVTVTYRPGIEQLLVLLPLTASGVQSYAMPTNNPTGIALSDFGISIADPPVCTVGFLPPSQWRSPADETVIDTPDGLYCKLPQDSPISVRGARNAPCMEHPGKRAPTVEICNSDKEYQPLAMRQHATGPYPFDPNLVAQGIPLDSRVNERERLYAPIEGTPPGNAVPPPGSELTPPPDAGTPPPNGAPPLPAPDTALPQGADAPPAAPAGFAAPYATPGPSVAVAPYNVVTGQYTTPGGAIASQTDLVGPAETWQELMPR
ncbi:MCE family protein [Mycolicibacterium sp. OfavD-34-C]|uniref:MCE family protein n=1 Tax=Mycolicibacterium sp. OfavD-34-C TaxID=2917746 RepID=UPI001EF3F360|nr:MlaD family protein [Mycolicibacterium sp. OfavD-34-C]MCG7581210.1 MCE family protein [Mycolicibacterium sp. OfavD-34-C]